MCQLLTLKFEKKKCEFGWLAESMFIRESAPHTSQSHWRTNCLFCLVSKSLVASLTRFLGFPQKEVHGFSDASKKAYSAIVYLHLEYVDGTIQVSLASSKTKVAPLKKLTIPRLELCGAHLLPQLIGHIRSVIDVKHTRICTWTADSTIVLSWITGEQNHLKSYVVNRVADIVMQANWPQLLAPSLQPGQSSRLCTPRTFPIRDD